MLRLLSFFDLLSQLAQYGVKFQLPFEQKLALYRYDRGPIWVCDLGAHVMDIHGMALVSP